MITPSRIHLYAVVTFAFGVLIALILNLALAGLSSPPPDEGETADATMYVRYAEQLATGEGYHWEGTPTAFRMPGTSLILAPVFAWFGVGNHVAGRLTFCLFAGATLT
ncbi:MAG: hypothetical protein KDD44_13225, partial [Bdellovibrionales bacterium]|nr:hypothetical protein [Bdellovibrionales bacterium]